MDKFCVETIQSTPHPQQIIWAAMHQDYSEELVITRRDHFPDEAKAGELIIKHLLAGNRGHYGPLEHPQIVLNVGYFPHSMMQQLRTHRTGISFDVQCLAGDTEITFVDHKGEASHRLKKTIAELYDLWTNGEKAIRQRNIGGRQGETPGTYRRDCRKRLQKMRLRVLNEETGFFETGHIQDVMCSGLQPVYRLTLESGHTLDCTTKHRLFTDRGWKTMASAVGLVTDEKGEVLHIERDRYVMCNGVAISSEIPFYQNQSWLKYQIQQGKTAPEIAQFAGCTSKTIRLWSERYGLNLPKSSPGRRAGEKPNHKNSDHPVYRDAQWLTEKIAAGYYADEMAAMGNCSISAIKKWVYHHGLTLNKPSVGAETPWNKNKKGKVIAFQQWQDKPKPSGCKLCAHPVRVIMVEYLGVQMTYDIEIEGPWHNFIANGLVVHNSFRYSGSRIVDVVDGKRAIEEVFYLRPVGEYTDRQGKKYFYSEAQRQEDLQWCYQACERYQKRIGEGLSEEHARGLIPFDVRQHFVLSCNLRTLMHLLDLRWKKDAQLEIQAFCELLYQRFEEWAPAIAQWYKDNRAHKARLSP